MGAVFDTSQRPHAARLIAATLAGSIVGAIVLLAYVFQFGAPDWNTMTVAVDARTPAQALATFYLAILLGGVLPTLFIGFGLIAFDLGSPLLLVLAPATLFVFILGEMTREMGNLYPTLLVFPAIMAGGATMLLLLLRPDTRNQTRLEGVSASR